MAEKDIPLDAPPSYSSANVPYTMPNSSPAAATTTMMTIVQGAELQQGIRHNDRSKYSCGNPLVEVAERIARIVFMLVLIAYGGVAIATMTRLDTDPTDSVYYEYDYEEDTPYVYPFLILVVLIASLCCTVGSLLCDIPVLIIQFTTTNKVMNSVTFRTLDIAKWTGLSIGYVIVFILIEAFVQSANRIEAGPVIVAYLVFCGTVIVMGIIMAIWDCSHLFVNNTSTMTSTQVVTMVPANSTQVV